MPGLTHAGDMPEGAYHVVVVACHFKRSRPWIHARAHMPTKGDALAWAKDQEDAAVRSGADLAGAVHSTQELEDAAAFRMFVLWVSEYGASRPAPPLASALTVPKLGKRSL
jgi:hypothetical protein